MPSEPMCTIHNWARHPASIHGVPLCRKNLHPMTGHNLYYNSERTAARCRACHNACVRAYRLRNLEKERARVRRNHRKRYQKSR